MMESKRENEEGLAEIKEELKTVRQAVLITIVSSALVAIIVMALFYMAVTLIDKLLL